jgi:hypothetical protein
VRLPAKADGDEGGDGAEGRVADGDPEEIETIRDTARDDSGERRMAVDDARRARTAAMKCAPCRNEEDGPGRACPPDTTIATAW